MARTGRRRRRAAALGACAALLLAASPAPGAEHPQAAAGWALAAEIGFEREAIDRDEGAAGRLVGLHDRVGATLEARRETSGPEGGGATQALTLERYAYPDAPAADRLLLEGRFDLEHPLAGSPGRLRWRLQATQAQGEGGRVYSRLRGGLQLSAPLAPRRTLQARLRLGYRDQDDRNTFRGYDQAEALAELAHAWQPPDWSWYTLVTLYGEGRRAEAARYSYQELGARALARWKATPRDRLTLRAAAFARGYAADARSDLRWTAALGHERELRPGLTLETYLGYTENASTDPAKSYEGLLAGARLRLDFR